MIRRQLRSHQPRGSIGRLIEERAGHRKDERGGEYERCETLQERPPTAVLTGRDMTEARRPSAFRT
jgi:hypothetical protein